jgi:hypothetical protein
LVSLLEFLSNSGISVGGAIAGFPSGFIDCYVRGTNMMLFGFYI